MNKLAFGINRKELQSWKLKVKNGEIAFITHYWLDDRFPGCHTVTKVGCNDIDKLTAWGRKYGLQAKWIHQRHTYPHFDLFGDLQKEILMKENLWEQIERFKL